MSTAPRYLVGIDVGGTFTDILAYDPAEARLRSAKVPSIPGQQWRGVLDALAALGIEPDAIRAFVHGTTIATNALLERQGAPTGLVTTKGFRDVLEIGKARRLVGGLFDTGWTRPPAIVPRHLRIEVPERVAADGSVQISAQTFDFAPIAEEFSRRGIRSVAIAFMNSYVNDVNEAHAAQALKGLMPEAAVSHSAALVRERGEFERTSTCVLNAYLTPLMVEYLDTLAAALRERGVTAPVNIMGSNGGAMTLAEAARRVAGTFLSGPVGGVSGAIRVAEVAGLRNIITFDMGGTSTDVALVHGLSARMSFDNQIDAYPLQMPQLDIHAIGAGGGSVIWVGSDGTLQIGPRSAGAVPGPACYGHGGTEPTISDANLILGRLPVARPLAGGLMLDRKLAENAFRRVADVLGTTDIVALADGALRIAVAKMAGAVREVSVHRGFDPRDFSLVGFGGAGPMHIFQVADELGIPGVMIPRLPGHLCALGQMLADLRRDTVAVWGGKLSALRPGDLEAHAGAMREQAERQLRGDGIEPARQRHEFTLDIRYVGQSFTLPIPWRPGPADWTPVREAFETRHRETFGYAAADNDIEVVNIRVVSLGLVDKPELKFNPEGAGDALLERRRVWFSGWVECPVYQRDAMRAGDAFQGPAIIEEAGGTSVIPPGWSAQVHEGGSLICAASAGGSPR
ncbi:MAG: hydantoinase/oxoprolinase family protein [Betaproteobacteria bacterium]|nr:MAG: hydantoinase/oxoprolinase family protein [Betaproteobacteria bacterium]